MRSGRSHLRQYHENGGVKKMRDTYFYHKGGGFSSYRGTTLGGMSFTFKNKPSSCGITTRIGNFVTRFNTTGCIGFGMRPSKRSKMTYFGKNGIMSRLTPFG